MNLTASSMRAFQIVHAAVRDRGVLATVLLIARRLREMVVPNRDDCATICRELIAGKVGLEIGGPSQLFSRKGLLPIYRYASRVDNCNFSTETVWEGEVLEGAPYCPEGDRAMGTQFVREAVDLTDIANEAYDFFCSCHTLEHVANPLRALEEWIRILRPGGTLMLVLPHREATFDHRRPVTALEHLIRDREMEVGEDDLTHLEEILSLHDLSMDLAAGDFESFSQRSRQNFANRCLHHHVFDTELAIRMVDHAGLRIIAAERASSTNIIILCIKPAGGKIVENSQFLASPVSPSRAAISTLWTGRGRPMASRYQSDWVIRAI